MAIERNPCEDVEVPVVREPEGDDGQRRRRRRRRGNNNQPNPPPEEQPEIITAPFPKPFLTRNQEEYEPHTLPDPAPYARTFAAATRRVTVIPNELALTENGNMIKAMLNMNQDADSRRNRMNNGKVWLDGRSQNELKNIDLFRWSLFNFWVQRAIPNKKTAIAFKPSSGHENPFADTSQDIELSLFSSPHTLRFYTGPDIIDQDNNTNYSKMYRPPEQLESYPPPRSAYLFGGYEALRLPPMPMYEEEMRFCLYNDTTKLFVTRGTESKFLERYAPPGFDPNRSSGIRAISAKSRLQTFLYMHLFGAEDGPGAAGGARLIRLSRGTSEDLLRGMSQEAKSYYSGVLPIVKDLSSRPAEKNFYTIEPYRDYVFDAPVAFFEEELNGMLMSPFHSAKITKKVGNVDFVNLKGYVDEREVPNVYHYYNSIELKKDFEEAILKDSSRVEEDALSRLGVTNILNAYTSLKKVRRDTDNDGTPDTPAAINMIYKTPSTLKFPSDRVEKLEEINEFMKGYAENYVEININTTQGGQINSLLQKNKLGRHLMDLMYPPLTGQWANYDDKIETKVTMILDDSFKTSNPTENSVESTLNDVKVSDIPIKIEAGFYTLLKKHIPESANAKFQNSTKSEYPLYYYGWDNVPMLRLEDTIRSQIFCREFEEFVSNAKLQRAYADLLSGEKAYSEVVGYCVKKFKVLESGEEELIQTFLLMDSNEIDTINFLDSQVIPFKKYKYKIFSVNFVLATEYRYDKHTLRRPISPFVDIKTYTQMVPYLIEAPFFEETVEIRDMPPMRPQISFLPTQGVDDKIKILMTMNYGEVKEPYRQYAPGTKLKKSFKQKLKTKYGMDKDGLIHWKTDSIPDAYEVRRINVAPENYNYFFNAGEKFRSEDPEIINEKYMSFNKARLIEHDMEPNKYYYYIFRAIDNYRPGDKQWNKKNALYSNPTEVFRIRMVSYANGIFLEMDPYEMKKKTTNDNIVFERLLKINPNFDQTTVDYSNTFDRLKSTVEIPKNSVEAARQKQGLLTHEQYIASNHKFQETAPNPEELSLGNKDLGDNAIWSKRFKIRIRSKDSGKMIDLNVKFVQDADDLTKEE